VDCHPTCPPDLPVATLEEKETDPDFGLIFEPPPEGGTPAVTAEQAENLASAADGSGNRGSSEQAMLVLLPPGGTFREPTLVWQIRYPGIEMCGNAPFGKPFPPCVKGAWVTLIDATTGEFIEGHTAS
jgi:hypothetical protein